MHRLCLSLVAGALLLATLTGCIELTGQRLGWRHDARADAFTAVLFYDGIHDRSDQPNEIEQSKKKLSAFVESGNIMLVDWYGELNLEAMRNATEEQLADDPFRRAIHEAAQLVETRPLGHYTAAGRIGAAQYIHIRDVSKFLELINGGISASALAEPIEDDADHPERVRTARLRRAFAERGGAWIALDGQAIRVTVPFDPQDWARRKAEALSEMFAQMLTTAPAPVEPRDLENWHIARFVAQLAAGTPVSVDDRDDVVTFTIGSRERKNLARLTIRDAYNDHHVATVERAVPTDLHAALVEALKRGDSEDAGIKAAISLGPPEASLLALCEAAAAGDPEATERLRQGARAWNASGAVPAIANVESELPINLINGVRDWRAAMIRYPLESDALRVPEAAPQPAGDGAGAE